MRNLILFAAAGAFAAAAPAVAGPKGHGGGHGGGHGRGHGAMGNHGMAMQGCPPGLAKKGNGCLPPGQAKKLFSVGERVPAGYAYSPYKAIPARYRDQIPFNRDMRYVYRDDTAYVVDPRTNLVTQVIDLLLR